MALNASFGEAEPSNCFKGKFFFILLNPLPGPVFNIVRVDAVGFDVIAVLLKLLLVFFDQPVCFLVIQKVPLLHQLKGLDRQMPAAGAISNLHIGGGGGGAVFGVPVDPESAVLPVVKEHLLESAGGAMAVKYY